ncbi:MAG: CHAP domain-containing protein [Acidimicrobiales bacterium]|jgi:hypothetical protein
MRGPLRFAAAGAAAVVLLLTVTATVAAPAGAVSVGAALQSPHVYAGGGVLGFNAPSVGQPLTDPLNSVMVAQAADPAAWPSDPGYWLASADGGVYALGSASFYGSLGALRLQGPVVAIVATPDGRGYWLAALDGGVFAFGDAGFYGSMGGQPLNQPIVGMAATPDGRGYWLVAADGGVFAFGDAPFLGSMGGTPLVATVTGMAATHSGFGYWLVAGDGGIFSFGDAAFYGSMGDASVDDTVIGMAATPNDGGYYLVTTDGGLYTEGDAVPQGSLGGGLDGNPDVMLPVVGVTVDPDTGGYWMLDPDGFNYDFSNPPDPDPSPTASAIVSIATGQVNADPDTGYFCNPYGPCEAWCALFATWVWEASGVHIPSYAFTGDIYYWSQDDTGVLPPTATPLPGDAVLYGTGPWSVSTSLHTGLVAQVWPDGAIVTVEGDAGPGVTGNLAVVINGPYLPSDSMAYNGMPIYAYAQP